MVTTIMNVREKVVIDSRSKKYHVCQVVAVTNLPIAGCLTRAFLSFKQQRPVVRTPFSANPGLNFNPGFFSFHQTLCFG